MFSHAQTAATPSNGE
jgi:hypothetical protein